MPTRSQTTRNVLAYLPFDEVAPAEDLEDRVAVLPLGAPAGRRARDRQRDGTTPAEAAADELRGVGLRPARPRWLRQRSSWC